MSCESAINDKRPTTLPGVLMVVVLSLSGSGGCLSTMAMDTAEALDAGESATVSAIAAGHQRGAIVRYDGPRHPDWPQWRNRRPGEFPPAPFQFEWMMRLSEGLGHGMQFDLQIGPIAPQWVGGGLGAKWQLFPASSEALKLAVVTRGFGGYGGHSSGGFGARFGTLSNDTGAIFSLHLAGDAAVYVSPRVRWDYVTHRSWVDDAVDTVRHTGRSYSTALGFEFAVPGIDALYLETVLGYSPYAGGRDGWRYVFGVGHRAGGE